MNQLPDDLKDLLRRGDPARDVTPALAARVASRLDSAQAPPSSWRFVTLGLALVTSAALGAGGTLVVRRLTAPTPPPPPAPPADTRPAPAAGDPLAEEAALLQSALEALQRNDSARALELLDAREARFQPGLLAAEARVARVRVLLARGDDDAALRALAALPESDVTVPLRLSWARLLVSRKQCDEARAVAAALGASEAEAARGVLGACAAVKGPTP